MRSLILGAGGQIGAPVASAADACGHLVEGSWYRRPLDRFYPLDLRDGMAVRDLVVEFEPDVVFLAAGMSQIDFAESHPQECFALAEEGSENVARAAQSVEARVVLFTSEQIFGDCPHPADETAIPEPMSVYGKAQVKAEATLRKLLPDRHLIVRTSCVYGPHALCRNPALHIVNRLRDGATVEAAKDRFVQPTYAPDLAAACLDCVERRETGTIHIVGGERLSEYAFAKQIAFLFGYDCDRIEGVPAAALGEDAPRPLTPWLDRTRLRSLLGSRIIRPIGDGLRATRDADSVHVPHRRAA